MFWQTTRFRIDLTRPQVMGIVNVTPDSFSDGGLAAERTAAIRHCEQLLAEGADLLLVKPALPNLDIVAAARAAFDLPVAAYQVSGEYAMIQAGSQLGWIDGRRVMLESLTSIVRAGAGMVITYAAGDVAAWLREDR